MARELSTLRLAVFRFGQRQVSTPPVEERLSRLEAELARLQSALRQLETEQVTMHEQVRRWMRRAVAAERAAERNQERPSVVEPPEAATPVPPPRRMWGARERIAARRLRSAPTPTNGEDPDGVHP